MKHLKSIKEMADVNEKCKNCEGSGIIQCWLCEGRGESEVYGGTYEDCSECSKGNQICVHCNGSGKEVDREKALKFDDELEVNYKKELQTLYNRRK